MRNLHKRNLWRKYCQTFLLLDSISIILQFQQLSLQSSFFPSNWDFRVIRGAPAISIFTWMRLLSSLFVTNVHIFRIWTRSHDVIWWKVIWQILCSVLPRLKQILFHFNYLLAATALITLAHSFDQSSSMLLKLQKSFINIPSFL